MKELQRLSASRALALMREHGFSYLDVRSRQEFEGGHPTGAYNVPLMHMGSDGMQPNPEFLAVVESSFEKDRKLILGCRSGNRSLKAAEMLLSAGYTEIVELRPGYGGIRDPFGQVTEPGWEAEGLPTSMDHEPGHDYAALEKR